MKLTKKILVGRLLVASIALVICTEGLVRLSGIVDFPLYSVDQDMGYIPQPSQSGKFLNKNSWSFNNRSTATEAPWNPGARPNILLIGNSIVMGGNPYDQSEKIGPLIQKGLDEKVSVWPIAAGAWSTVNETAYLERNPDVVLNSNFFAWEYMHGGLSQLSQDRGEYVFPTEKPLIATWYVLRRYVLPRLIDFQMNELPPTGQTQSENMQRFEKQLAALSKATKTAAPGILFFFPSKAEYIAFAQGVDYVPDREVLSKLSASYGLKIIEIAKQPAWNANLYRDGTHPTVEGNRVLADVLASAIRETMK